MRQISSVSKMKEYILRRLGAPVINIELDDSQLTDRIEDSLQYFIERHYDGVEEVWMKKTISVEDEALGYVTMPEDFGAVVQILNQSDVGNASSVEVFDNLEYQYMVEYNTMVRYSSGLMLDYYLLQEHLSVFRALFGKDNTFTFNKVTNRLKIYESGLTADPGTSLISGVSSWGVSGCSVAANAATLPDGTSGAQLVTVPLSGDFDLTKEHISTAYPVGTYTGKVKLRSDTAQNITLSLLDENDTVVATKTVYVTTNWRTYFVEGIFGENTGNNIKLKISGTTTADSITFAMHDERVFKNNSILVHAYLNIDPDEDFDVFNDHWFKRYATAMAKEQWGSNLKKFEGVQMPGGVTLNGQQIYNEAQDELTRLREEFSVSYELPVDMMIG